MTTCRALLFLVALSGIAQAYPAGCPSSSQTLYGLEAGGFCCDGTTDGNTCDGSVCALDPGRSQGNPLCYADASLCPPERVPDSGCCGAYDPGGACVDACVTARREVEAGEDAMCRGPWGQLCPGGFTRYGELAGGFCCGGETDGDTCDGEICALDPGRAQGYALCAEAYCAEEVGHGMAYRAEGGAACCDAVPGPDGSCPGRRCTIDPAPGETGCLAAVAAAQTCPWGQAVTGGGFCCAGAVVDGLCQGDLCDPDPFRTSGLPPCAGAWSAVCDVGQRYGEYAGGFCCDGAVDHLRGTCDGAVCALDAARSQGNPLCRDRFCDQEFGRPYRSGGGDRCCLVAPDAEGGCAAMECALWAGDADVPLCRETASADAIEQCPAGLFPSGASCCANNPVGGTCDAVCANDPLNGEGLPACPAPWSVTCAEGHRADMLGGGTCCPVAPADPLDPCPVAPLCTFRLDDPTLPVCADPVCLDFGVAHRSADGGTCVEGAVSGYREVCHLGGATDTLPACAPFVPPTGSVEGELGVWGNYCGPEYGDPTYLTAPADSVDAVCRDHDRCYDQRGMHHCDCDRAAARDFLGAINAGGISVEAALFASAAWYYFSESPCFYY